MTSLSIFSKDIKNEAKRHIRRINHLKNLLTDPSRKFLVLTYHRVLPEIKAGFLNTVVSLSTFNRQIEILTNKFHIISLKDSINQCLRKSTRDKMQVALTFDDGYYDNYEIVYPILKARGIPATFFIVTDYIGKNRPLWDFEVADILRNNKLHKTRIGDEFICRNLLQSKSMFILSIINKMKSFNYIKRQEALSALEEGAGGGICNYSDNRCMTWQQLKEMSEQGMDIGSHSFSHPSLSRISLDEAMQEIKKSKDMIENNIGKDCLHFAFPYGSRSDYSQKLIDYTRECGFRACLINIHGYNHIKKNIFCFKRIIMEETTDLDHLLG
jgi:peptidoglycan/xylan/chitin deacetylase (PgdA/CDA1 family)